MKHNLMLFITICVLSLSTCQISGAVNQDQSIKYVTCYRCHGTGWETCPVCGGSGIQMYNILGIMTFPTWNELAIICTRCHGSGQIVCTVCNGRGVIEESKIKLKREK